MNKKALTVTVILLFIGVATAPSINANVVEDELVDFDVEFCGLNKKHTVKLTQQEADEVEELLDNIEKQFENVVSVDEAETIISNAIVQLHKYELLGDLSIKQAQKLIIGNKGKSNLLREIDNKFDYLINMNLLCYVNGHFTRDYSWGPIVYLLNQQDFQLLLILLYFFTIPFEILSKIYSFIPIDIFKIVTAGDGWSAWHGQGIFHPSQGRIITIGLLGLKIWSGDNLVGNAHLKSILYIPVGGPDGQVDYYYPALIGFNGIKIFQSDTTYYIGFALKASFSYYEEDIWRIRSR